MIRNYILRTLLPLALLLGLATPAWAGVELFQWQPAPGAVPWVIPVREGEAPETAIQSYLAAIRDLPEFTGWFEKVGALPIHARDISRLQEYPAAGEVMPAVLVANDDADHGLGKNRIRKIA